MKALATGGVAAAAACVLTSTLFAANGIQITTKTTGGGSTETTTIQVDADHIRATSTGMKGGSQVFIFDGVKRVMDILDLDKKTYTEITKDDLDRMAAQMSGMMAQMNQAMANMPPAQRAQMEAMMKGRMSQMAQTTKIEYRKTGSDKVGAWTCDKYEGYRGTQKAQELCTVDPSALGFSPSDFNVTQEMHDFIGKVVPQRESIFAVGTMNPEGVTGVSVRSIDYGADGTATSETELTGVTRQSLPDSTFTVPSGFQKQPFAPMGRGR